MPHNKYLDILLLASGILTNDFSTLVIVIEILYIPTTRCHHSNHKLPVSHLHLSGCLCWKKAMSSGQRHCSNSVAVRPPSLYAPLALTCTHAGGLLKDIQTPSWWDHSCSLSPVLTSQTLCPFLFSKTNNISEIFSSKSGLHHWKTEIAN